MGMCDVPIPVAALGIDDYRQQSLLAYNHTTTVGPALFVVVFTLRLLYEPGDSDS